DLGDRVGLTAAQSLRSRAVEARDSLNFGNRNMRIREVGERKEQRTKNRASFGFEAELINDIFGLAVPVVIDVEAVEHLYIEIQIIGSIDRILTRNDVHDKRHFPGILPTPKRIRVGVISRRIE